jgi:hypothetical protein
VKNDEYTKASIEIGKKQTELTSLSMAKAALQSANNEYYEVYIYIFLNIYMYKCGDDECIYMYVHACLSL